MKRVVNGILYLMTAGLLAGSYMLHVLAHRKLGLIRWLNYNRAVVLGRFPLGAAKLALLFLLLLWLILLGWQLRKKPATRVRLASYDAAMLVVLLYVILAVGYEGLADFMVLPFAGLAAVLQLMMQTGALRETSGGKTKAGGGRMLLIAIALLLWVSYIFVPEVHLAVRKIVEMFASGDFRVVREFVESYGGYAAAVSFLLMIFQSIAAPLPAFLITFANANLFGWWKGAILSWTSAMAGAAVCFYIARILGREAVEKLTSRAGLEQIDEFFERHGRLSIIIARLLPFISFDIVSYAAGLTSMSFLSFMFATGIGQLPATIVYSYVGGMLTGGAQKLVTALFILFGLSGLIVLLRQVYRERQKRKEK